MAAKIKDGLFIGDAETSQSEVFINDNKISNLINLAGREVPNVWASHGLVYLTYYWEDRPDYKLFSSHEDALLTDIVEFIDVSISHGISVLLFSRRGTGRCVVAACVYLMMKYRWGFEKTYDYVYSKKPDIDLNKGFIQQMFALDMKLLAARQKGVAARLGVPNTFKIEANMTITDISAMLPPNEAKRWNSWDPDYVLEGAERGVHQSSEGEYKGHRDSKGTDAKGLDGRKGGAVALSGPGTGEDDELILIYSFLNSKNTITALPGPYLDVYSIPKDFKLKFNPVCFEEDVNWFPSNASVRTAIRGALKGCRARHAAQLLTAAAQPKQPTTVPHHVPASPHASDGGAMTSAYAADSKRTDAKASDTSGSAQPVYNTGKLENIAPMYIINSQREAAEREAARNSNSAQMGAGGSSSGAHTGNRESGVAAYYSHPTMTSAPDDGSPPTSAHSSPSHGGAASARPGSHQAQRVGAQPAPSQQQGPGYSSDLYEFVGIQNDPNSRSKASRDAQRSWGPRDSLTVQRDQSLSSIQTTGSAGTAASSSSYADYKRTGAGSDYADDSSRHSAASRRQPSPQPQQQVAYGAIGSASASAAPTPQQHSRTGTAPSPAPTPSVPLSAEERLRNLMADMQRHKAGGASTSANSTSITSGTSGVHQSRDFGDRDRAAPVGPSLYELATMQVVPGAARRSSADVYDRGEYEEDDLADPLSAFQRRSVDYQGYDGVRGSGSGAVRARHDVQTSAAGRSTGLTGRPAPGTAPRTAWGSSGTGSRGVSPSNSRPASPSPADARSGTGSYGAAPGRYASPSAGNKRMPSGGAGTGSVSSNLSVNSINSAGSNAQVVGTGASSSSRVYR